MGRGVLRSKIEKPDSDHYLTIPYTSQGFQTNFVLDAMNNPRQSIFSDTGTIHQDTVHADVEKSGLIQKVFSKGKGLEIFGEFRISRLDIPWDDRYMIL